MPLRWSLQVSGISGIKGARRHSSNEISSAK
jgi:hypothetical protein